MGQFQSLVDDINTNLNSRPSSPTSAPASSINIDNFSMNYDGFNMDTDLGEINEQDKISDNYIPIIVQIFENNLDLVGKKTKNGTEITSVLVPLVKPDGTKGDVIVYKGVDKNGNNVILKVTEKEMSIKTAIQNMDKIKKSGIQLYKYELDHILGDNNKDYTLALVMEELKPITKDDVFLMLIKLIPVLFKWRTFMAHCDIKPENIMKAIKEDGSSEFYFIDYDSSCTEKMLHGYVRNVFTHRYAVQSSAVKPVMVTFKEDLLELITAGTYIYYEDEFNQMEKKSIENPEIKFEINNTHWNDGIFRKHRIFSIPYLTALNIDDNLSSNDSKIKLNEYLLLYEIQCIYNIIKDNNKATKSMNDISKIGELLYKKNKTNESIANTLGL